VNVSEVAAPVSSPLSLSEGVNSLDAVATLVRGMDPQQLAAMGIDKGELEQAVNLALQEQQALQG
jgi:hypothetical protein